MAEMVKNSGVRYVTKGALEGVFGDGRVARALGIIFVGTEVGCDGHISTTGYRKKWKQETRGNLIERMKQSVVGDGAVVHEICQSAPSMKQYQPAAPLGMKPKWLVQIQRINSHGFMPF